MRNKVNTEDGRVIWKQVLGTDDDDEHARWISTGHEEGTRPVFSIQRFTFKTDRRSGRVAATEPYYRLYLDSMVVTQHGKNEWSTFSDASYAALKELYRCR